MFRSDRLPHKLSHGILALRTEQRADPFGVSSATRGFAGFYTHLDGDLAVALEPLELSGSLLDDLMLDEGSDHDPVPVCFQRGQERPAFPA